MSLWGNRITGHKAGSPQGGLELGKKGSAGSGLELQPRCPLGSAFPSWQEGPLGKAPEDPSPCGVGRVGVGKRRGPGPRVPPQALQCDVSVEEGDRQEWTFTLYDFDNCGKVTREVGELVFASGPQ